MPSSADAEGDVAMGDDASALSSSKEDQGRSLAALNKTLSSHAEPDAQTIITDFLDFTDYLPSDVTRSLTLIGKLDENYTDASLRLNELTTIWGQLPSLPSNSRPSPAKLRKDISASLEQSMNSRVFAHAEAVRMFENVSRHYGKAKLLLEKLQSMMDNYPSEEQQAKSPVVSRSPQISRANKPITLHTRRQKIPRITVPGEVLAPYDIEYANFTDDDGSSDGDSDANPPGRRRPAPPFRIKLQVHKSPKNAARAPRPVAPASELLTAAHAANQAALRRPPPPDAVIGSADAPWLRLTDYELAKLRKRMKKNAAWTPSETMIARELKALGRGPDAYQQAKKQAETRGEPFEPQMSSQVNDSADTHLLPAGAVSTDYDASGKAPSSNQGMNSSEDKRTKPEAWAKMAAEEAEAAERRMAEAAKNYFGPNGNPQPSQDDVRKPPLALAPAPARSANSKRKRDNEDAVASTQGEEMETSAAAPNMKRTKVETPVMPPVPPQLLTPGGTAVVAHLQTPVPIPVPPSSSGRALATSPAPSTSATVTTMVPLKAAAAAAAVAAAASETPVPLPRKASNTPIHPPVPPSTTRETRGDAAKRTLQGSSSAGTRAKTPPPKSVSPTRWPSPHATPAPEPMSRPQSRGQQPSLAADRPRRASTTRNTPAPESSGPPTRKRAPRPAPGVVSTTNSGGNSAVGKRAAPPKKKKSMKKIKGQVVETEMEEVDDEGNPIDADEPRYCLCNRVSFGTMIQCDNVDNCKQEWFHLECVGLEGIPARTTKWYCPDCRKKLGLGEKGEVSARGVRK